MTRLISLLAAGLALAGCSSPSPARAPAATAPSPARSATSCQAPEASQFDFYLGTWNMSWSEFGSPRFTGLDVITRDGCRLNEVLTAPHFLSTDNYRATSVTAWEPARRQWVQRYHDNNGPRTYVGNLVNGEMVLISNTPPRQRLTWREIGTGSFTWELDTSPDAGSWNVYVVVSYHRG